MKITLEFDKPTDARLIAQSLAMTAQGLTMILEANDRLPHKFAEPIRRERDLYANIVNQINRTCLN